MSSARPITAAEEPFLATFGAEFRRLRLEAGVGQTELGRICHVSHDTVYLYERGKCRPRRSTIEKLAGWLVPFDQWPTDEGPSDEQEHEVVRRLVDAAGPALAAERETRDERIRRLAREMAEHYVTTGEWPE